MSDSIIAVIISGVFSLIIGIVSALIAARRTGDEVQKKMEINQAVMDTKLEELTREVRKHNDFAERIPVLETQVGIINKQLENALK